MLDTKTKFSIIFYAILVLGAILLFLSAYYWWIPVPQTPLLFILTMATFKMGADYYFNNHTKVDSALFGVATTMILISLVGLVAFYQIGNFYFSLIGLAGLIIQIFVNYSKKQRLKNQPNQPT